MNNLAEKAKRSKEAANKLLSLIYDDMFRYAMMKVKSKADAEDIIQSTMISIIENLSSYDKTKSSFKTWSYTICNNKIVDLFRKKSKGSEIFKELVLNPDNWLYSSNSYEKTELIEIINSVLPQISEREREIIELKYFAFMKNKEISEMLEIKEKTVSSMLFSAKTKLKKILIEKGVSL